MYSFLFCFHCPLKLLYVLLLWKKLALGQLVLQLQTNIQPCVWAIVMEDTVTMQFQAFFSKKNIFISLISPFSLALVKIASPDLLSWVLTNDLLFLNNFNPFSIYIQTFSDGAIRASKVFSVGLNTTRSTDLH